MARSKPTYNMANYALYFCIADSGNGYIHPIASIRRKDDTSDYELPIREFTLRAQGDRDSDKLYAARFEGELSMADVHKVAPILEKLNKAVNKYLANNLEPKSFGENVFMLGKCLGIDSVYILKPERRGFGNFDSQDKLSNYSIYRLKDAIYPIDYQITQKMSNITRCNVMDYSII